jgi:hypothetical protein
MLRPQAEQNGVKAALLQKGYRSEIKKLLTFTLIKIADEC